MSADRAEAEGRNQGKRFQFKKKCVQVLKSCPRVRARDEHKSHNEPRAVSSVMDDSDDAISLHGMTPTLPAGGDANAPPVFSFERQQRDAPRDHLGIGREPLGEGYTVRRSGRGLCRGNADAVRRAYVGVHVVLRTFARDDLAATYCHDALDLVSFRDRDNGFPLTRQPTRAPRIKSNKC